MTIFDALTLLGGLCLFLFGMNLMGAALERRAGGKLQSLLSKLTTGKVAGLLTGIGVTGVIQSSSATTVMVVGFVNSGLMTLRQAINVIMGANIGTTVTAWILSLGGISGDNIILKLLKPTSFTPVLALIGIIFYMFCKSSKKKDTGVILLGFATLMFGMDTMSGAVSGLADVPAFANLFIAFQNPILGVLAGAFLTAVIQSSSASVGILQALAQATGRVSFSAAVPIIMGQNIGTCITAMLSSVGANKNAKRAALVHLCFNILGTVICLCLFTLVRLMVGEVAGWLNGTMIDSVGIATVHSIFNILCTLILLPMSGFLEKLACRLVPDDKQPDTVVELDERLLVTPAVALEQCHTVAIEMAECAVASMQESLLSLTAYTPELAERIRAAEDKTDHYEDVIGTFLVKLSSHQISDRDSTEAAKLLKIIGDFERISDHAVNLLESAEELRDKGLSLSPAAEGEIAKMCAAVGEILDLAGRAFRENDMEAAALVEPLEQVIDYMKDDLRSRHIRRLQQGGCSIEAGFIWSDLITNLERTSDHCSNIAGCVVDAAAQNMNIHESLRLVKRDSSFFKEQYVRYADKYTVKE